ncbi:unnamed protein product [Paramecium octaurelia]|uniref:Uncharacterized protein n=1 Tax=Paramecium octaurelia TaxID=43137 RepID=A0A8S1YT07_PAROT|nr:unnamed protein product [Paramecium octaurelia]
MFSMRLVPLSKNAPITAIVRVIQKSKVNLSNTLNQILLVGQSICIDKLIFMLSRICDALKLPDSFSQTNEGTEIEEIKLEACNPQSFQCKQYDKNEVILEHLRNDKIYHQIFDKVDLIGLEQIYYQMYIYYEQRKKKGRLQ